MNAKVRCKFGLFCVKTSFLYGKLCLTFNLYCSIIFTIIYATFLFFDCVVKFDFSTEKEIIMSDCIFCKIINGEIPSSKVYEDDKILCFKDIAPMAPIHLLVIPKEHIASVDLITNENCGIVAHIFSKIPEIAKQMGISEGGYRVITNHGRDARQSVRHLHFHVLAGKELPENMG